MSNYFVNGKTERDMLDEFVDANGKRYATNPNYEEQLRSIYNKIGKETNIDELVSEFHKYKIITSK